MPDLPSNSHLARILICEYEGEIAEDIAEILKQLGYEVVGRVYSGQEAIRTAEEAKPDLILMDINLAGEIDGIQASEQIRARFGIPVIFLTAHGETDLISRAKVTEPYGFLAMPVPNHILGTTIESVLYKHAADKRVRESEQRYRTMVEQSIDGIVLVQGMTVRFVNRALAKMFGFQNPEEMVGQNFLMFVAPEYRDLVENGGLESEAGKSIPEYYEFTALRKDGTPFNAELRVHLTTYRGEEIRQGIVRDITERKKAEDAIRQSEARRAKAEELAGFFSWEWDIETGRLVRSAGSYRTFGLHPGVTELDTDSFINSVHADDRYSVQKALRDDADGVRSYDLEFRIVRPDGEERVLLSRGDLQRDEKGRAVRMLGMTLDITERKQAEKDLYESREMLQTILDTIPTSVFWKDCDSVYLGANRAWLEAAGMNSSQEVMGKTDYDLPWEKDQANSYREDDRRVMESGIPEYGIIEPYTRADGSLALAKTNKVPVRDLEGNVVGVLATYEDITERIRAAEALLESEERYRQLAEVTFEGILFREGGNLVHANHQYYEMLGYSREELEGKEVVPLTIAPESLEAVMRHIESGTAAPYEAIAMKKDGTRFPVELRARTREISGRKLRAVAVRDVSARNESERALRESEAKYRALVDTTDTGYVIVDAQGRVLDANAEYVRLTGHATLEEIRGRSVLEWTAEYHKERNSRALEQCVAKGFIRNLEIDYVDERSCVIPIEVSATVMSDAKCGMQITSLCRDVTNHKMIENRLRASLNEKEVLLREIHHRVKNNLQLISSLLRLQLRQIKHRDEGLVDAFGDIQNRIKAMALVHEALYQSENLELVDASLYIQRIVANLRASSFRSRQELRIKTNVKSITLSINVALACGLIVNELVTNSLKHAFPEDREGEVVVSLESAGETEFQLTVRDNGVGMPQHIDVQHPESLGLELVTDLARQLNGTVEITRGEGTEFRVRFPGAH